MTINTFEAVHVIVIPITRKIAVVILWIIILQNVIIESEMKTYKKITVCMWNYNITFYKITAA